MSGLLKLWTRYERWLAANAPDILSSLNPSASDAALNSLEQAIGAPLPQAYRELYRLHDGQPWNGLWVFPEGQWMPIEQALEDYQRLTAGPDSDDFWPRGWVPMIYDGGSGYIAIVCPNAPGGENGALYDLWFEGGERSQVADGIEVWLQHLLAKLDRGTIIFDPSTGLLDQEEI